MVERKGRETKNEKEKVGHSGVGREKRGRSEVKKKKEKGEERKK